jgi:TrmH family RNA methyltransferase
MKIEITSPQNAKLKEIRRLRQRRRRREREGLFVAEGEDLLGAADAAGWPALERFCAAGSGLEGVEVDPMLLNRAAGLASGARALGIYRERWLASPSGPLCVYLHGVRDPGNVGTILRAAHAFGASCVALGQGSADPYSPRAVRASMGAIFAVALVRATPRELPGLKLALAPGRGEQVRRVGDRIEQQNAGVSLIVGGEREGLPDDLLQLADVIAQIPIATDSLNVAMATTVALYELSRIARA